MIEQQAVIRTDLWAMKFQPHTWAKTQPEIALRTRGYRVCCFRVLQHQLTCSNVKAKADWAQQNQLITWEIGVQSSGPYTFIENGLGACRLWLKGLLF
ncbi:MAG: hypothetical protein JJ897_08590 [Marinibacterium sp.]|nr:hypothetical protein [Marinibacterium sp.]